MVPPWVPDPVPPNDQHDPLPDQPPADLPVPPPIPSQPTPIAPPGRFGPSRANLGRYAQSGSRTDMQRGLGHYVRKGLGGANTATRRFGGTAVSAGALYSALSGGGTTATGSSFDLSLLVGRSANDIIYAVADAVQPIDGTQDAEARHRSVVDALSELLKRFPEADLQNLSEEQKLFTVERFVGIDVYALFYLDVGKSIQAKAPSATVALARGREVKDYIKEAISAVFRQLRATGQRLTESRLVAIVRQTLQETFQVFEDYVS